MPLHIEATSVVALNSAIEKKIEGGLEEFQKIALGGCCFSDDCLSQAGFMSADDAHEFAEKLKLRGLASDGESPEFTVVQSHDQSMKPGCDWLILFEFKGHLIATMRGNESRSVIARSGWDPDAQPELQHMSAEQVQERLEFVERKDNVDVYRDRETGKLLYSARIKESVEEVFKKASDKIWEYNRAPGARPTATRDTEDLMEAIGELQKIAANHPDDWRAFLMLGKGWYSIDDLPNAKSNLTRAHEIDKNCLVMKELAGVCLEMKDFDESCRIGEQAVALEPDNTDLLGNLAVAYLLNQQLKKSQTTIDHALKLDSIDPVNNLIANAVRQVIAGERDCPSSLAELSRAAKEKPAKKRGLLRRWFGKN